MPVRVLYRTKGGRDKFRLFYNRAQAKRFGEKISKRGATNIRTAEPNGPWISRTYK